MKLLKYLFYLSFYPLVFFIDKIKKYIYIKFAHIDTTRVGHIISLVEGYLVATNFYHYKELKNCKIIFYLGSTQANSQSVKIIKRLIPIYPFTFFFHLIQKSLIYWGKKDHIIQLHEFAVKNLLLNHNDISKFYKKPFAYFTDDEKERAYDLIKNIGIQKGQKWICIHNRDSRYLRTTYPNYDWSYHNYRNFSVNSLKPASEFFASKGYCVLRMGYLQEENLISNNPKIIDYANSSFRNEFLDIYLLANCEFYFGADSGPSDIAYNFMKPAYGINFSSTLICSGRSHLPWLFIFKRIKNLDNGKLFTFREILSSSFASSYSSNIFKKHNALPIENSSDEIKSLAVEIIKERKNEKIEDMEDINIQKKFWKIFYQYVDRKNMGAIQPKVSPSFLRNNLDLLN